jgi:hypothetical protein
VLSILLQHTDSDCPFGIFKSYKTKGRVTQTPLKTGGELRCSGRVRSSCSTSGTRRVNLVTNPVISRKWGKDRRVFMTSGTYPWSFGTQILNSGQPSHGEILKWWLQQIVVCPFVLFLLAIVLSILLQHTDSDCPFGIFKLFLYLLERTLNYSSIPSSLSDYVFVGCYDTFPVDNNTVFINNLTTHECITSCVNTSRRFAGIEVW